MKTLQKQEILSLPLSNGRSTKKQQTAGEKSDRNTRKK